MAHVLFLCKGTGGDLWPFIRIGIALQERGHHAVIVTHCVYEDDVRQAGLGFAARDTPDEFRRLITEDPLQYSARELIAFFREHHTSKLRREFDLLCENWSPGNTVVVAHHNAQLAPLMAAERLQGAFMTIFTAPSFVSGVAILESIYQSLSVYINQIRAEINLPSIHDWRACWRDAGPGIGLWSSWFGPPEVSWPAEVVPTGFILRHTTTTEPIPTDAQEIIRSDKPCVLISHGTSPPFDDKFFSSSAEACAALGWNALLVTEHEHLVPSNASNGVKWFKYLPFGGVMPHVDVVIHHGGIGTSCQALAAGTPQLVLAFGYDRPDNAVRLQRLGVAEHLSIHQWKPEAIAGSLQRLVENPSVHEHCKQVQRLLDNDDSVSSACDAIEAIVPR